ncbi:hypothetical protein AMTRI_Chr02g258670 [Amborella trichopoda]
MNPDKLIVPAYARAFVGSDTLYRDSGIVRNEQGLVQDHRIRLATWNVGTFNDKRKDNNRNGIGIIVDKDLKNKVVHVKQIGDRLLLIKLVLGEEIINVISAYAPQVGLDDRIKRQFWEDIDGIMGETILDFAMAYDLAIVNNYFKKRDEHLITYKTETHNSQIGLFLVKKKDRSSCKDCKIMPGESLTTQHRLVVMVIVEFKK